MPRVPARRSDTRVRPLAPPPHVSLRAVREAQGLTLVRLVELIDAEGVTVHAASLNNIETGRRQGSADLMAAWARALGMVRRDIKQARELLELVTDLSPADVPSPEMADAA